MGGRGTGSTILGTRIRGQGIIESGSIDWKDMPEKEWEKIIADFNPNAFHKNPGDYKRETLWAFADTSKERGGDKCEYLGAMKLGYVTKIAQGTNGSVSLTPKMRAEISGMDVTHYHNRYTATDQEKADREADIQKWRSVKRAYKRLKTAEARYKKADEDYNDAFKKIQRAGANPYDTNPPANLKALYDKKDAADRERTLAMRQKNRAIDDYRERFKAYDGNDAPKDPRQFGLPRLKDGIINEEGWKGGCFSPQDIDSSLLKRDIPSFSASCDEGVYTITITKEATDTNIMTAKDSIRKLFDPKIKTEEALAFRKKIRSIDRITNQEGIKKGWSKERIIAASINRQLDLLWNEEVRILGENKIIATFTERPGWKPKWEY